MKNMNDIPQGEFLSYISEITGSNSFCLAKWYNATIWLGSGMTTSCHHPLPHYIPVEDVEKNPKALHNTPQKKYERGLMQLNKRPEGCDYCWKIEDMGPQYVSDRVYKTNLYSHNDMIIARDTDPQHDVDLKTLEIAFDRTCNLACSYCNPAFSSTWVKDIKQSGPYENLLSDGRNHFTHPHDSSQRYRRDESNPYVEAFFKWWDSDLSDTLQELRITGGEPFMSDHMWKLFEKWDSTSEMQLAINSNLCIKDDLLNRFITYGKDVKHLHLYTSCESYGAQAEYIRDGLNWNEWTANIDKLCETDVLEGLHMMCTVNALCLESLPEFLDFVLTIKEKYGKDFPTFTLNILRFPSFQSALVLPLEAKQHYQKTLAAWLAANKTNPLLHEMELNQVSRLIDYLVEVEVPNDSEEEMTKLTNDFVEFHKQYDTRRGKDFRATFPEIAGYMYDK